MSWYAQSEAATLMKISTRTLRRRIRAGDLAFRREGRNVLIEVPDRPATDSETHVDRPLADVKATSMAECSSSPDAMTRVAAAISDLRQAFERQVKVAKRSSRLAWTSTLALSAVVAGLAWAYREATIQPQLQVQKLQETVSRQINGLVADAAKANGQADELRQELEQEQKSFETLRSKLAVTENRMSEMSAQLNSVLQERDHLARELAAVSGDRDQVRSKASQRENELFASVARVQGQVGTLQEQLGHERKTTTVLRSMLANMADKASELSTQMEMVRQERDRLTGQLAAMSDERDRLRSVVAVGVISDHAKSAISRLICKAGNLAYSYTAEGSPLVEKVEAPKPTPPSARSAATPSVLVRDKPVAGFEPIPWAIDFSSIVATTPTLMGQGGAD